MTASAQQSATAERLHALDAVRGFALLLGIFYHAALSFLPFAPQFWMVADNHPSTVLSVFMFASHSFRMTTFFLIAGFFARLSLHRLGITSFVRDRGRRIALPLVVGWLAVTLAFGLIGAVAAILANHGRQPPLHEPPAVAAKLSLTHLWFLYVLIEFYAITLLLRAAVAAIDRAGRIGAGVDHLVGFVVCSPLGPILLALPVSAALLGDSSWTDWPNIRTPDHLVTTAQAWIVYGLAFGFGFALHRQSRLIWRLQSYWLLYLAVAIASIVACLLLGAVATNGLEAGLLRSARAMCYAVASWTATLGVVGAALRFLSSFSKTRRYIADASYWLYIVHLPIIVALQIAVARLGWPWPAKYATIMAITLVLGFVSYQYLVRYRLIGTILNGPRTPPAHPAPP
ncbi:acyltransferase family protein [Rhodopseudomonas palustris]|nr:acyltransferase family protein [Rhodopseudomonas palustris]